MEALYYLLGMLAILAVPVIVIIGLIKPKLYKGVLKAHATRPRIVAIGFALFIGLIMMAAAIEPASVKQARLEREQANAAAQELRQKEAEQEKLKLEEDARNKETTKEVEETQTVVFTEQTREDATLTRGQSKVVQEGQNGEKTITYTVMLKGGVEVSRTVKSEVITKEPVAKVTAIGTYVAPTSSSGGGYTNSQGNYVPSPSSNPAGATAQCRDGTYSYSQSRRGTCSHHGGVATWL